MKRNKNKKYLKKVYVTGNSLCCLLPKKLLDKNNISKGDMIYFQEQDNGEIILRKYKRENNNDRNGK